ncbi:OmpA family protein, partial [Escherichia coli]|uniref:OmpA family protein n=1 Tax=Escherichia coli TaxID=562 RepID=UPI003008A973
RITDGFQGRAAAVEGHIVRHIEDNVIPAAGYANTLTGVAMVLKEYPKTAVNVIGYTDSTGGHDLNMRLSQQRADSVASALITQGVDASRIRTQGLGPANPIASNSTAEGKAQNRRVEITLSPL